MKKGNEQCFCEGSRMLADKVAKLSKQVRILRAAIERQMKLRGLDEDSELGKALLAAKHDETK